MVKVIIRTIASLLIICLGLNKAAAFPVYYKEQYYKLFHQHYIAYPDDIIENIYYLEMAQKANFANPLYALAKIEDRAQWQRYRILFSMHLSLKLIEQHLRLGSKFAKQKAYFYNAPWKQENLAGLETAETAYQAALLYWPQAKSAAAEAMKTPFLQIEQAENWIDEAFRIVNGSLDYERIIRKELAKLERVRNQFQLMNENYY